MQSIERLQAATDRLYQRPIPAPVLMTSEVAQLNERMSGLEVRVEELQGLFIDLDDRIQDLRGSRPETD